MTKDTTQPHDKKPQLSDADGQHLHLAPKRRISAISPLDKPVGQQSAKSKIKNVVRSKPFLIGAPIAVVALVGSALFVEPVKFTLLNVAGDASATFVVVDDETKTPVEGATITIGKTSSKTDKQGKATLTKLNYGTVDYTITKESYDKKQATTKLASSQTTINPVKVHSQGVPLTVSATQTLNGKALRTFTVKVAETTISSQSGKDGKAIVKIPTSKLGAVTLAISAEGYNTLTQATTVSLGKNNSLNVTLTKSGKQYFLSNRDGKLGVYGANLDGTQQELIIAGTNTGNDYADLAVSPDGKYAALSSRRDSKPALFAIDLIQKQIRRIDEGAETFNLYQWINNTQIAYVIHHEDSNRPDHTKLKSANMQTGKLNTLAAYPSGTEIRRFDADSAHVYIDYDREPGAPYYPIRDRFTLISFNLNTKKTQELYRSSGEIYVAEYKAFDRIKFGTWKPQENKTIYFELNLKDKTTKPDTEDSGDNDYKAYIASPSGEKVAWVEVRDGKSTLLVGDKQAQNEKASPVTFESMSIMRWIDDDTLVVTSTVRRSSSLHTIDIESGKATKISDIFGSTYYY